MAKAIGMVEMTTVSSGYAAADEMAKAADVEILQAEVTCPGKFVALVTGEISAVRAAVDAAAAYGMQMAQARQAEIQAAANAGITSGNALLEQIAAQTQASAAAIQAAAQSGL